MNSITWTSVYFLLIKIRLDKSLIPFSYHLHLLPSLLYCKRPEMQ